MKLSAKELAQLKKEEKKIKSSKERAKVKKMMKEERVHTANKKVQEKIVLDHLKKKK